MTGPNHNPGGAACARRPLRAYKKGLYTVDLGHNTRVHTRYALRDGSGGEAVH